MNINIDDTLNQIDKLQKENEELKKHVEVIIKWYRAIFDDNGKTQCPHCNNEIQFDKTPE